MSSDVIATLHNEDAHRCVKIIKQSHASYGFSEFRRDPEDAGGWSVVREGAGRAYASEMEALAAARSEIAWLREMTSATKGQDGLPDEDTQ